jgi:hypothetical protein
LATLLADIGHMVSSRLERLPRETMMTHADTEIRYLDVETAAS